MSAASIAAYKKLLNSQPESERYFDTFEITHPSMSQTFYYVNDSLDLVVTDASIDGGIFTATNAEFKGASNNDDLDQLATFTFPDLDNLADDELDLIDFGDPNPVQIIYRRYHSDYLDSPADGPFIYSVTSITQAAGSITFQCGAPSLNSSTTGRTYNFTDFPMLRGI